MLAQRLRRMTNIKPALAQYLVLTGKCPSKANCSNCSHNEKQLQLFALDIEQGQTVVTCSPFQARTYRCRESLSRFPTCMW